MQAACHVFAEVHCGLAVVAAAVAVAAVVVAGRGCHQLRCSRYADRSSPGGRKSRWRLLTFICLLPSRSAPVRGQGGQQ